jgi:hypothetical protein
MKIFLTIHKNLDFSLFFFILESRMATSERQRQTEILLRSVLLPNKDGLLTDSLERKFKSVTG